MATTTLGKESMDTTGYGTKPKALQDMTVAEASASGQTEEYNKLVAGYSTPAQSNTITSDQMTPTPSLKLPETKPTPTQATGLGASIETQAQDYKDTATKEAEAAKDTSRNELINLIKSSIGETSATDEAYRSEGVDTAKQELNDINNQLISEQVANRRRIEQIEKNAGGMLSSGVQAEINRINKESISKQADLAVIQMAKQNNYFGAKEIADRSVAAKMEEQRQNIDLLNFIYEENKADFSKADDRAYQALITKQEREADEEEAELKMISDLSLDALENGAPTSIVTQMRQAKTSDDAIKIGGQYVGKYDRLLKETQLAKAQKEMRLLGEPSEKDIATTRAQMEEAVASVQVSQDKIDAVDILKDHAGLNNRVGTSVLSRVPQNFWGVIGKTLTVAGIAQLPFDLGSKLSGSGQDFAGGVHKLIAGLSIEALLDAKARGATFGALSDSELQVLSNSASAIADWEIKDKNGKGIGIWNIDEASFKREMDTIQTLTRRALIKSQGKLLSTDESSALDELYKADTPVSSYY